MSYSGVMANFISQHIFTSFFPSKVRKGTKRFAKKSSALATRNDWKAIASEDTGLQVKFRATEEYGELELELYAGMKGFSPNIRLPKFVADAEDEIEEQTVNYGHGGDEFTATVRREDDDECACEQTKTHGYFLQAKYMPFIPPPAEVPR